MRKSGGHMLVLLRDIGPMSRAELARTIGISAPALTKLAGDCLAQGLVEEREAPAVSGLGRPPVKIAIRPQARFVIGANIGAGRVAVVLSDLMLGVRARKSFTFDFDRVTVEEVIENVCALIEQILQESALPRQTLVGIGVGVPGKVDKSGRSNVSSKFRQWAGDVPFADIIEHKLGLPVTVEHNATAMALAEAYYGAGKGYDSVLHLYLRTGLGAGLVHARNGQLTHPGPVEIGHIVVHPDGAPCVCGGRGCVETVFSERALLKALGVTSVPKQGLIAAAMENSDVWAAAYKCFVEALATTITLLGPQLILLGGHLGEAPDAFVASLRADLPRRLMPQFQDVELAKATLQPDAGALGAACVGLEKFVFEG